MVCSSTVTDCHLDTVLDFTRVRNAMKQKRNNRKIVRARTFIPRGLELESVIVYLQIMGRDGAWVYTVYLALHLTARDIECFIDGGRSSVVRASKILIRRPKVRSPGGAE